MEIDNPDHADTAAFRELLLAYLLQSMPGGEREKVNRRMLVDEDFSSSLKDAEYDLLDAYSAGELDDEQRKQVFLALISQAPERVVISRAMQENLKYRCLTEPDSESSGGVQTDADQGRLTEETELVRESETGASVPVKGSVVDWQDRRRARWHWMLAGVAASLVAAVTLAFFGLREMRKPGSGSDGTSASSASRPETMQTEKTEPRTTQLERPGPQNSMPNRGMDVLPKTSPALSADIPESGSDAGDAGRGEAQGALVMTMILPEAARGIQNSAPVVKLRPGTQFLRVVWPRGSTLSVAELPGSERDRLLLQIADDKQVLATITRLRRTGGSRSEVAFLVPVKDVLEGEYLFRVMSPSRPGDSPQVYSENLIRLAR